MNKFWHLVKFNIIFNRVSMAFLTFLALFIVSICHYFYESQKELGEALIQYSFYVMFMIFTGKMNSKNSMMFDIKHLLALPLTKKEIILLKSFADSIQLFPMASVFLYGVHLAFPAYDIWIIGIMIYLGLTLGNIISFNKRIDFSRMQHSKASFKNSFLFLHKYLEIIIQIILTVIAVAIVFVAFEKNIFMQEYGMLILIVTGLFLASSSTLKMLKDETRSYFVFKRDVVRIGWKTIVVIVPLLLFHKVYKGDEFLKELGLEDDKYTTALKNKLKYVENVGNKRFLLSIIQKDNKAFNKYLAEGNKVPWEAELMGSFPPHLAAVSGNQEILGRLLELKPDSVNLAGKYKKKTPIYSALRNCKLGMVEYLIKNGANINHQDIDGNTAMIFAAQRKCYGGIILLQQNGAKVSLKNLKGHNIFKYVSDASGIKHFLNSTLKAEKQVLERELASKKNNLNEKVDTTLKSSQGLLQQE